MRSLAMVIALVVSVGCRSQGAHDESVPPGYETAPRVGAVVPEVKLTTSTGTTVALADSWRGKSQAIVVFYRGFY
jgi:hypothetical protein